jgi:hypothetical protein
MAKEWYRDINFRAKSLRMINWLNKVIANYQQQGLKLSLRQMYYVGVSQNVYPNSERSYKNLGNLVSDARLAGLMDWDAIEDRVRRPRVPSEFSGVEQLIDTASYWYRLPRWEGQENYVELWVEKDALAGVLAPIASEYHVTMMVNRGYSSQSAMYEAGKRYIENCRDGRYPHLIYLGDMDPSGEDMVRDISDRLEMYNVGELNVTKVALTMDQVESYKPPPNPAKMSDSRAAKYVDKHGTSSWEVDALPPAALSKIIRDELSSLVDRSLMDKIIEQEDKDKQAVREMARAYAEKQRKAKKS